MKSEKIKQEMNDFKTCELVQELGRREGVEVKIVKPYQDIDVSINGPAMVLIVID